MLGRKISRERPTLYRKNEEQSYNRKKKGTVARDLPLSFFHLPFMEEKGTGRLQ